MVHEAGEPGACGRAKFIGAPSFSQRADPSMRAVLLSCAATLALAKTPVIVPGWPVLPFPFSTAVISYGGVVHISGMQGFDFTAKPPGLVPGGIVNETRQTMQNIAAVMKAARNATMDDILECQVCSPRGTRYVRPLITLSRLVRLLLAVHLRRYFWPISKTLTRSTRCTVASFQASSLRAWPHRASCSARLALKSCAAVTCRSTVLTPCPRRGRGYRASATLSVPPRHGADADATSTSSCQVSAEMLGNERHAWTLPSRPDQRHRGCLYAGL